MPNRSSVRQESEPISEERNLETCKDSLREHCDRWIDYIGHYFVRWSQAVADGAQETIKEDSSKEATPMKIPGKIKRPWNLCLEENKNNWKELSITGQCVSWRIQCDSLSCKTTNVISYNSDYRITWEIAKENIGIQLITIFLFITTYCASNRICTSYNLVF